jgi:hypothetical protein
MTESRPEKAAFDRMQRDDYESAIPLELWGSCTRYGCLYRWCGDVRRRDPVAQALRVAYMTPDLESATNVLKTFFAGLGVELVQRPHDSEPPEL